MPFCTECGHENPSTARFCSQCGQQLVAEQSGTASETTASIQVPGHGHEPDADGGELSAQDTAALDALPADSALLIVQRGPSAGSRFLLDTPEVSAGRHPDSDIFLDDVTVSRRHARFQRVDGGYAVSDAGSLNGTYVNRDRVDEIVLSGGDEVQIGKYRLVYFPSQNLSEGPSR
ncbi:MAG: FHA domain-containing protein [Nocardioidaceae bacterium]|jgi:pSer/pThr/pTyr-binding forkhead associated (FHA) protein|nr:FHA domain-containing protein [Nocardioidaceae bacterium]